MCKTTETKLLYQILIGGFHWLRIIKLIFLIRQCSVHQYRTPYCNGCTYIMYMA